MLQNKRKTIWPHVLVQPQKGVTPNMFYLSHFHIVYQLRGSVVVKKILVSSAKCPTSTAVVEELSLLHFQASCSSLLIRHALISSQLHI